MIIMKNPLRWDNLSWTQLQAAAKKEPIVIMPVGSIEQHGPHLPVGCDYILAQAMAEKIAAQLDSRGVPVLVAPTVMAANSIHHMSFAGTITLQPQTFIQMLTEYCRCITAHGFKKIVFVNGHGGNTQPIGVAQITINEELGIRAYYMGYWSGGGDIQRQTLESQSGMIHACEGETSLMLAIDESLVDPIYKETKGDSEYPTAAERAHKMSTFHRMEDMTANGVMGNSYLATKEKGERMIAAMVSGAADLLCAKDLWA